MVSRHHKSRANKTARFLLPAAAALSTGLGAGPVMAQDCYRLVDITALGFIPNPNDITFGINDQHEAVGAYMVGQKKHAFLWLPAAAYNLTKGFHDLHTLADLDRDAESAAYEINDDGIAVGWTDDSGDQHAFVWQINLYDPAFPPLPTIDLATFSVPDDGALKLDVARVAWAINNADPPVVVGDASGLTNCACPPNAENVPTALGFKAVLDGSDALQELLPILSPPCDVESYGRDIGSLAVGYSDKPQAGGCFTFPVPCANRKDGVRFFPTSALTDLSAGGSESRGVNDSGSIVGWGFESGINPCQMSALFWEDPAAAPFNLGTVFPIEPGDQTRAEAITNPDGGIMLIVGLNETTQHALRWQGSGVTWTVVDLNTKIVNQCFGTAEIVVRQSHDVSNDGWIVAWADFDPGPSIEAHAVILVPDQNCQVCCFADLDCDGVVGVKDLLALLSAWGPCQPTPPTEVPKTVQECYDKFYPQDMEALIACIEAVSDP